MNGPAHLSRRRGAEGAAARHPRGAEATPTRLSCICSRRPRVPTAQRPGRGRPPPCGVLTEREDIRTVRLRRNARSAWVWGAQVGRRTRAFGGRRSQVWRIAHDNVVPAAQALAASHTFTHPTAGDAGEEHVWQRTAHPAGFSCIRVSLDERSEKSARMNATCALSPCALVPVSALAASATDLGPSAAAAFRRAAARASSSMSTPHPVRNREAY